MNSGPCHIPPDSCHLWPLPCVSLVPLVVHEMSRRCTTLDAHLEAESAKRRRLDEEAALAYRDFVASFDARGGAQAAPRWIRGGVVDPASRADDEPAAGDLRGSRYEPPPPPPARGGVAVSGLAEAGGGGAPAASAPALPNSAKGGQRAIDAVLEELRRCELGRAQSWAAPQPPRAPGAPLHPFALTGHSTRTTVSPRRRRLLVPRGVRRLRMRMLRQ